MVDDKIRKLRSQRIMFMNGLMDKPNNNAEGFVSDIVNMEISEDGVAQRRKGSFCLYNPSTAKEWYLWLSTKISGCDIIFLMDYSGNIFCLDESYPEILMTLNKSGFTKIYYPDTKEFSYEIRFDRGTKFFYQDRADTLTFMNDFGDTITINKKGSIRFAGTSGVQESYDPSTRSHVESFPTDAAVFMNVAYSRKNNLSSFYMVKANKKTYDSERKHIPRINSIRGEIRVAQADNMGRVGRLSQSVFLSKYGEYFVSVIPAFSVNGTVSKKIGLYNFGDEKYQGITPGGKRFFISREAGTEKSKYQLSTSFGSDKDLVFSSLESGVTIAYVVSGTPITSYVDVTGKAVSLHFYSLTANDAINLINSSSDAIELISVALGTGTGAGDLPAMSATPLVLLDAYESFDVDCKDQDYDFSETLNVVENKNPSYRRCVFAVHPDTEDNPSGKFLKATMWMDYQFGADTDRQVAFSNVGCIMKAVGLRFMRFPNDGTDVIPNDEIIDTSVSGEGEFIETGYVKDGKTYSGVFSKEDKNEVAMYITSAEYREDVPFEYDTTAPTLSSWGLYYKLMGNSETPVSGILFEVLINLPSNYIKNRNKIVDICNLSGSPISSKIRTYGFTDIFVADIPFILDGSGDPEGFYPAQWIHGFPNNEQLYVGLRNLGFDCWKAKRNVRVSSFVAENSQYYDLDVAGTIIQKEENTPSINEELFKNYDLLCRQEEYDEWFKSGSRFVVWNDGNIVAVSQKCFANSEDLVPVYSKSNTSSGNRSVNYQNDLDMIGYLPVCAIENIYLRGFSYNPPPLQKDIQFIKSIAENSDVVFMVENGVVWIGSNLEMLLFNYKATMNDSVDFVCRMDNGVVAFSKDNISFVDPKGNVIPVHNLADFKNVTALKAKYLPDGNVYGVTSSGELFRISIQYTENNNKYYQADNISKNISETVFDSSTDIAFSNNTIWFSRDSDIYGFSRRGWTKKNVFGDNKILGIFTHKDSLCVIFYNEPMRTGRIAPVRLEEIFFNG